MEKNNLVMSDKTPLQELEEEMMKNPIKYASGLNLISRLESRVKEREMVIEAYGQGEYDSSPIEGMSRQYENCEKYWEEKYGKN